MTHREAFFSSVFLGLCAAGLSSLFSSSLVIIAFNFFSTTGGYLFLRKQEIPLSGFYARIFELTSVLSVVGSILCLLEMDETLWWIFLVNSVFTLLYYYPRKTALRSSRWLKPISIATAWTLNVAVLSHYQGQPFLPNEYSVFLTFISFWALTFFLSLYYDLKDAEHQDDIVTLASQWGLQKITRLGLIVLSILSGIQLILDQTITNEIAALWGAAIYLLYIDYTVRMKKADTYVVDATYLVYIVVFLLCKHLV